MKKYPPSLMKLYNLFLEFSEKVDRVIDKLEKEQGRIGEKIMKLMEEAGEDVDAGDMAEAALTDKNTPPEKGEKNR